MTLTPQTKAMVVIDLTRVRDMRCERFLRPGVGAMDSEFLKQQAAHCRLLAEKADPFIKRRLLDLAVQYDARFERSLRGRSRTFGTPSRLRVASSLIPRDTAAQ